MSFPDPAGEAVTAYYWTILPADSRAFPLRLGLNSDLGKTQAFTEPMLFDDDDAFLILIEAVRPCLRAAGLLPSYQRTGCRWIGRRARGGGICWI